jgi:Polyketide cyclase / dehydrase and lipid transport
MASIRKEISIDVRPEDAWAVLRDFPAVHERLVPGFVTDARMDGDDARIVTFFNGVVVRETLVGIDDAVRRLAYAIMDGPLELAHYNGSAQVFPDREGCRFVWIVDVLPDEQAEVINDLMGRGIAVIKTTLESHAAVG